MTTSPPTAGSPAFVDRVKNILMQPAAEWDRIATEPVDLQKLYLGYLAPLAGAAAIAGAIGLIVFPPSYAGFGPYFPITPTSAIAGGVVKFVMSMVFAYVWALIINALAPSFGSQQSPDQAQKLSVYSATAGLVAGLFSIIPTLAVLSMVGGIYSLVLLYMGLPRLMKTPEDKRIGYFVALIAVAIVIGLGVGAISTVVMRPFG